MFKRAIDPRSSLVSFEKIVKKLKKPLPPTKTIIIIIVISISGIAEQKKYSNER